MITLHVSNTGHLNMCSQLEDYEQRGEELNSYSYFRFVIDTYEEVIPPSEREKQEHEFSASSSIPKRGRPRNERSHYLNDHSKYRTHR